MSEDEKNKLSYDAILRELHHLDNLVEKHSELVIAISGAAFAFAATQLHNAHVVYLAAVFGIAAAVEWILKTIRHRQIFLEAHKKLTEIEQRIGLNVKAARSFSRFMPNGFTILLLFAALLIPLWGFLCYAVGSGFLNPMLTSAGQVVEAVTKDLPTVTGIRPAKWTFTSMAWDAASQSYDLVIDSDSPASTWLVTYDTLNRRIVKLGKSPAGLSNASR
jgi:hypothetical protein